MYGTAYRITRRHDLADDVAQEAFMRAWQALSRFDLARPFGPWICRIAANLAVNHVRSPRRREEPLPAGFGETPEAAPGPLEGMLEGEARRLLEDAMGRLSAEQRAVFVLRVHEEMTYLEIAAALDVPVGTVMSRLARAREQLRQALAPYLGASVRRADGSAS